MSLGWSVTHSCVHSNTRAHAHTFICLPTLSMPLSPAPALPSPCTPSTGTTFFTPNVAGAGAWRLRRLPGACVHMHMCMYVRSGVGHRPWTQQAIARFATRHRPVHDLPGGALSWACVRRRRGEAQSRGACSRCPWPWWKGRAARHQRARAPPRPWCRSRRGGRAVRWGRPSPARCAARARQCPCPSSGRCGA